MAWIENPERKCTLLAALALPLLLANCTTSPETSFQWNVNDKLSSRPAAAARPATAAPRPVTATQYADNSYEPAPYAQNPNYVIVPRQRPAYIQTASRSNAVEVREAAPVVGVGEFSWPVSGRVISTFGANLQGERNDGINIATPHGTPIRAAAAGNISYAGNELRGYGNLVLIRHDNGYVTAYAHADRLIVERGENVVKGQIIGYVGTTGDVEAPQVHFEIRKGVTPVNPQPLLVASR